MSTVIFHCFFYFNCPSFANIRFILEMSAAEFKNYLKSKGRNDPRGISIDMRRKYEIFQNM